MSKLRALISTLPRPAWKPALLAFALLLGLAVAAQFWTDADDSEFGAEPDEAAHYVTGLMMRDYVAAKCPGNPLTFAKKYYDHFPKVALGHWPPGFYIAQTLWTLPFGPGRPSILLFMAVLTALLGTLLFLLLRREVGSRWAGAGAALLLLLPLVVQYDSMVMTEIPIALLVLLGTYFYGRYLESERWLDSALYGVIAAAALLTKFSALSLAFVPLIGLLLTRKFYLLRRSSFWLPVLIVNGICGPWTIFTLKLAKDGMMEDKPSVQFFLQALGYFSGKLWMSVGAVVLILAMCGLLRTLKTGWPTVRGRYAALAALPVGVLILHAAVPAGLEARHLVPALAPLVFFAVLTARELQNKLAPKIGPFAAATACAALLVVPATLPLLSAPSKGYSGFRPVAYLLCDLQAKRPGKVLIVSDARGEGMFVSEAAMRDRKGVIEIKRASKLLAESSWNGGGYSTKVATADDVVPLLRHEGIRYVVIDHTIPGRLLMKHHQIVTEAMEKLPSHGQPVPMAKFPIERAGDMSSNGIDVYSLD